MIPRATLQTYACCVALVCLSGASCAGPKQYRITAKDIPILAKNTRAKIPLRAGFFVADRLAKATYTVEALRRPLYEPPTAQFDARVVLEQATREMFTEVVPVGERETVKDFEAKKLDVIVSVGPMNCESYFTQEGAFALRGDLLINITATMEWAVTSPSGRLVTSAKPIGEGRARSGWNGQGCRDAFLAALNDHLTKTYTDIVTSAWWRDSSWRSK